MRIIFSLYLCCIMNIGDMNSMIDILTDTPQNKMTQIAERVKQRRLAMLLTQAGLAKRADIPLSTYRIFEQTGKISLAGLLKIGFALNCLNNFDQLFAAPSFASLDEMLAEQSTSKRKYGKKNE